MTLDGLVSPCLVGWDLIQLKYSSSIPSNSLVMCDVNIALCVCFGVDFCELVLFREDKCPIIVQVHVKLCTTMVDQSAV